MIALVLSTVAASAQSVTPMRKVIRSFAPEFAIRLLVGNPNPSKVAFDVKVYDEHFQPVDAVVMPRVLMIGAENSRPVMVRVSFNGQPARKVRICAEGLFGKEKSSKVRTQVCGRYLAQHVGG